MTRTERSSFPRAMRRDRSESKSGLDKSFRKHGGGHHNWGRLEDEDYLEAAADADGLEEVYDDLKELKNVSVSIGTGKPIMKRRTSSFTDEEVESAKQFRKRALKGVDIDLSTIARTSVAVSVSPPNRTISITSDADTMSEKSV